MANKHNKCKILQHSLPQRNYRLNQPWAHHFLPTTKRQKLKRSTFPSDGKDVKKTGFSYITDSNVKWHNHFGKLAWITSLPNPPAGLGSCQPPSSPIGSASLENPHNFPKNVVGGFPLRRQLKALSSWEGLVLSLWQPWAGPCSSHNLRLASPTGHLILVK